MDDSLNNWLLIAVVVLSMLNATISLFELRKPDLSIRRHRLAAFSLGGSTIAVLAAMALLLR